MILHARLPREDLASVKYITIGAGRLDPDVHREFELHYGIPVLLVYGATEFGGPVAMMTPALRQEWGEAKRASLGRGWAGAELRVVNRDTGEPLPAGEEGLLEVQTPRMGPRWIRTSNLCVIDEEGFLWFRGRADGAINRGGFKILPESIETVLTQLDPIAEAAVVGLPDKRLGEVPVATVRLKPAAPRPTVKELEKHLREHLPNTHIPAMWRFVDEMPYTSSMKIDQRAVRRLFTGGGTEQ